jgi:hypothetical protein
LGEERSRRAPRNGGARAVRQPIMSEPDGDQ